MISPMTRTRRDFLSALSGVILVYVAPSPESQPDYITYWLFESMKLQTATIWRLDLRSRRD